MSNEFRMTIETEWSEVARVNQEAHDFLKRVNLSDSSVDTFTMVTCELAENAIKYGEDSGAEKTSIEVTIVIDQPLLTVQVVNSIGRGTRFHLRQLERTLQWVRGFQDPFQAYMERVREISRELADHNKSGLGIVRIAYEARATIDFIVGEDETLNVSAVAEIR